MNKFTKRMMPLLLLLFAISSAFGQTATLRGVVTDRSTGETMPGANVLIKGTLIGTSTDFDGNYMLENVPAGQEVEVEASFVGFLPTEEKTNLKCRRNQNLKFKS